MLLLLLLPPQHASTVLLSTSISFSPIPALLLQGVLVVDEQESFGALEAHPKSEKGVLVVVLEMLLVDQIPSSMNYTLNIQFYT